MKYIAYRYGHYSTSDEFVNWDCPTGETTDLSEDKQYFVRIIDIKLQSMQEPDIP